MSTGTTHNQASVKPVDQVIEAMRSIQSEDDRWVLSESLLQAVPSGKEGFDVILDRAEAEGVKGNLSANTLRLYRDTAKNWPKDKRVPNVSFSAHREAIVGNSVEQAVRMLEGIVKTVGGPDKVTVAAVRRAVVAASGRPAPAAKAAPAGTAVIDVLADIMAGGPQMRQAIDGGTSAADLDRLHAGLTKVLGHVERLRAKAAQKAAKASKAPAPRKAAPAKAPAKAKAPAAKASASGKAGDLRGL